MISLGVKHLIIVELDSRCMKALWGVSGARESKILGASVKYFDAEAPLDLEKAFLELVSEFSRKKKHKFFFYLPRSVVTLRNLSFPSLEDQEIDNIVQLHLARQVPYAREDIVYDYKVLQKTESGFTDILLGIVYRVMLRKHFLMFEKANIYGGEIRMSSFGLLSCAHRLGERVGEANKASIFIDIDLNYSDFIVYRDTQIIYSKSTPTGSKYLDNPVNLPKTIGDLRQSFTVFQTSNAGLRPERAYLSGMVRFPERMKEMLQKELNLPVDIVDLEGPFGAVEGMDILKKASEKASFTSLLGAFMDPASKGLTFSTSESRMKSNIKEMLKDFIVTGSLVVYLLVLLSFFSTGMSWLRDDFSKKLDKEISVMKAMDSGLVRKSKKIKLVDRYQNYSESFLFYYYNIATVLPKKITLERVIFEKNDELTLLGKASDMSEIFKFISILNETGFFKKVDLRYSRKRREEDKEISEFEINNFLHEAR